MAGQAAIASVGAGGDMPDMQHAGRTSRFLHGRLASCVRTRHLELLLNLLVADYFLGVGLVVADYSLWAGIPECNGWART